MLDINTTSLLVDVSSVSDIDNKQDVDLIINTVLINNAPRANSEPSPVITVPLHDLNISLRGRQGQILNRRSDSGNGLLIQLAQKFPRISGILDYHVTLPFEDSFPFLYFILSNRCPLGNDFLPARTVNFL